MNIIKNTALALTIFAGVLLLSANTVYQWTDENGVVHFSQTAPEDQSQSVVETSLRSAPKTGGTFAPPPAPAAEATEQAAEPGNSSSDGGQEYTYTKVPENCTRAREMLTTLNSGRQLRFRDPETGEVAYATDESLAEQRRRANAAIERDC